MADNTLRAQNKSMTRTLSTLFQIVSAGILPALGWTVFAAKLQVISHPEQIK